MKFIGGCDMSGSINIVNPDDEEGLFTVSRRGDTVATTPAPTSTQPNVEETSGGEQHRRRMEILRSERELLLAQELLQMTKKDPGPQKNFVERNWHFLLVILVGSLVVLNTIISKL